MSILIDTVRIAGFRGIKNLEISLPRVTLLIGMNNSGKTSLLKALHLALGDYSRHLSEEDFYIGSDDKRVAEILVDIRIVPVDDKGDRTKEFDENWQAELGDKIKAEANDDQYVALRTRSKPDRIKSGFDTSRSTLEKWTNVNNWNTERIKETKTSARLPSISFIAIEAQRDIHQEIREKSSLVGRVLSSVEYNETEITALELLIKEVNEQAIDKSIELTNLKTNLERLNQSFESSGKAEITPFPKKIRDLSKHFSAYFGETASSSFSMEYHGMGTRSWASMLIVKAFTELQSKKHEDEGKPFFPILTAEEPEAHLHPNAQKTLYRQLAETQGQIIVSTHSPYLAAMANQAELRYLKKSNDGIIARYLDPNLGSEDRRRLQREVIHSRGEILFAKALVLCEGETEEQALPLLFQKYFGCEAFVVGVNFIGVGGSGKYLPFLKFAYSFSIPLYIFSDGESLTTKAIKKNYEEVYGATDINDCPNITILEGKNFEEYLVSSEFRTVIELAIKSLDGDDAINNWIISKQGQSDGSKKTDNPPCQVCNQPIYEKALKDYMSPDGYDKALIDILKSGKTKFAPVIAEKLCELELEQLPPKILDLFQKIKNGGIT